MGFFFCSKIHVTRESKKKKILKSFLEKHALELSTHRAWLLSEGSKVIKDKVFQRPEIPPMSYLS